MTFSLKITLLSTHIEEQRLINSDKVEEHLNPTEDLMRELSQMR